MKRAAPMPRYNWLLLSHAASLASCAILFACGPGPSNESPGSSDEGTTEEADPPGASGMVDGPGLDASSDTTGVSDPPNPFEDAAAQACAVHNAQMPMMIPSGESPYQETGFGLGNEFPHRFIVDTTFVPLALENVPDGFVCYLVYPGQDDGQEWWFRDLDWRDPDGQIRVFMATAGVSGVLYYTAIPGHAPTLAPSLEFETTALCPELPRVWTPDPDDLPEEGNIICILPTSEQAEVVFVRVP